MLDGGPSRVPQPIDRRSASRAGVPRRYAEGQKAQDPEPRPTANPEATSPKASTGQSSGGTKKLHKLLIAVAVALLVLLVAWLAWTNLSGGPAAAIDRSKSQAVFFVNGQIYFGKLKVIDENYLKLEKVFYIKTSESQNEADTTDGQVDADMQLIKLGEEVHGPEDAMVINRDQVLYFENLKDDSQVSKLMKEYKASN